MPYTTIDDPSAHFQTKLYTGNSTNNTAITNDGNSDLQPDWIWAKSRTNAHYHDLRDSTRGVTKRLVSNTNDAESTKDQSYVSFDSDGFTLGDDTDSDGSALNTINTSSNNYVAWQWKANGGTTTTNDASSTGVGSIDSVYQANTTAGFSIVTYTGTGSTATVAHGLGAVPDVLIFKKRSAADNWYVYHKQLTSDYYLVLDTTGARNNDVNIWNDTDPTSTVFSIANAGVHADGKTMVCYAFAEKKGYSKFGRYEGNGNANGAFVYTGFSPAWIMIKNRTDSGDDWHIFDSTRDATGNIASQRLKANDSGAEASDGALDFLSNGFKLRNTSNARNSGDRFIYMAFAKSPYVSSTGTPTTARF